MAQNDPVSLVNGSSSSAGPSFDQKSPTAVMPGPRRRKKVEEGAIASFCSWVVAHQIGIAVNLLALLALAHISFPKARQHTRKFFALSYYNPSTESYSVGWDDMYAVSFWITIFTGARIVLMDYIMAPVVERATIAKPKDKVRFVEQAWQLAFYIVSFSVGMHIMYNSDYWLSFEHMWTSWPDRQIDGLVKWYYIIQFAFWLQSIFVLNIEEKRKDHWQMLTHHFITCALLFSSYGYHQTRVGNVILCIMDTVDLVLPFAKMLKYTGHTTACDVAFGFFMVLWFISRHIFYPIVVWSIYVDLPKQLRYGCYSGSNENLIGPFDPPEGLGYLWEPFRDSEGVICYTEMIQVHFVTLLLFLQVLLVVWFGMIVRLAIKVLNGTGADDPRSDEESDEVEMQDIEMKGSDYVRVTPEDLQRRNEIQQAKASRGSRASPPQRSRRPHGNASGVSLPSDRKELLGRIGCDKGN